MTISQLSSANITHKSIVQKAITEGLNEIEPRGEDDPILSVGDDMKSGDKAKSWGGSKKRTESGDKGTSVDALLRMAKKAIEVADVVSKSTMRGGDPTQTESVASRDNPQTTRVVMGTHQIEEARDPNKVYVREGETPPPGVEVIEGPREGKYYMRGSVDPKVQQEWDTKRKRMGGLGNVHPTHPSFGHKHPEFHNPTTDQPIKGKYISAEGMQEILQGLEKHGRKADADAARKAWGIAPGSYRPERKQRGTKIDAPVKDVSKLTDEERAKAEEEKKRIAQELEDPNWKPGDPLPEDVQTPGWDPSQYRHGQPGEKPTAPPSGGKPAGPTTDKPVAYRPGVPLVVGQPAVIGSKATGVTGAMVKDPNGQVRAQRFANGKAVGKTIPFRTVEEAHTWLTSTGKEMAPHTGSTEPGSYLRPNPNAFKPNALMRRSYDFILTQTSKAILDLYFEEE